MQEHLEDDNIRILDASWRLPGTDEKSAYDAYCEQHIPGAQFFDIDAIADLTSNLPHMCPKPEIFAASMESMGIAHDHHIVIYDDAGIFSAPRVWWTFRALGHNKVSVLDGGLIKWVTENRTLTKKIPLYPDTTYKATLLPDHFLDHHGVRTAMKEGFSILDARPTPRFQGQASEPRQGLRSGHIPGAHSVPFSALLNEDKTLKSTNDLSKVFAKLRLDPDTPTITSCGSGITAAIINLALERLGYPQKGIYDGAWAEWGDEGNDIATFPVKSLKALKA